MKKRYLKLLALIIVLNIPTLPAFGEDASPAAIEASSTATPKDVTEGNEKTMEMVVVTATKTERKASEVPAHVTVITQEDIAKKGIAADLSDALLYEAGLDMGRTLPNAVASISIRGMGNFLRAGFLINGQDVQFLTYAGRHPLQMIDPSDVERIEIVRGAGSALYGSDAIGGVLNVITKEGHGPVRQKLTLGYDTLNTPSVGYSTHGSNDRFNYNLNANYLSTGGYLSVPQPDAFARVSTKNDTWRDINLGGKVGYDLTDDSHISLSSNYVDHNAYTDALSGGTITNAKQSFENLEYRQKVNDLYSYVANLTYGSHADTFNFGGTSDYVDATNRYGGEFKNQFDFSSDNRAILGINYWSEAVDNKTLAAGALTNTAKSNTSNLGIYLQDEIALSKKLFAVLGARYDNFSYNNTQFVDYTASPTAVATGNASYGTFNPRAGLRYKLTETTDLRATAGTGFRAPLASEMLNSGPFYLPNPNLLPEKSVTYDLGIDHNFGDGLTTSLTGYYGQLTDAITWVLTGGKYQAQNIGTAEVKGVELEMKKQFSPEWSSFINYTYNESRVTSQPNNPAIVGKYMTQSPANKVGFGLSYEIPKIFMGSLEGRYVSDQYRDALNTAPWLLPSYFVADCKFAWHFGQTDLTLGANNLFGAQYTRFMKGWLEEPMVAYLQIGYNF